MSIYQVTLNGKTYTVEIPNINERPVRAIVDGEIVSVDVTATLPAGGGALPAGPAVPMAAPAVVASVATNGDRAGAVKAPLPGTVVEITVTEGDRVEPGQQLCVLEAMKMNNPIRAAQGGTVKRIAISLGQQVQHGAVLMVID